MRTITDMALVVIDETRGCRRPPAGATEAWAHGAPRLPLPS
jgi:hypothetical protein